jgi:N,N'-diacetylchitobiose transport system permease protein
VSTSTQPIAASRETSTAAVSVRRQSRRRFKRIGADVAGLLVFVVMIFPVYWMIATAFKSGDAIASLTPTWFPTHPTLANFRDAVSRPFFWSSVRNSVIVVVATVSFSLVVAFLAAVAIARFKFYGRKAMMVAIVLVQMIPLVALIIPMYVLLARVHLTDNLLGLILTYFAFVLPYTVWMLRGFVLGVPAELEEAAMVDGCSRLGAFFRILVPLVAPGFVATSIYAAIQAWNEYILAYVLLKQHNETITVWLASLTTLRGTAWGTLMAGSTLIALPIVGFFLLVQHRVAAGLTAGAVKG